MKHLLTICLMLGLFAGAAQAQDADSSMADDAPGSRPDVQPLAYLGDLPPLIDRELFFGDPEISSAQLSPDGQYITFLKPYQDARNIYIKGIDEPFDAARPLTADRRPIPGYFWSQDGKYVLYIQDKGGNENFHVYAVDPSAEPTDSTDVPPARDLTPLENVRAFIYAVPENAPSEILIGLNDRDPAYHDVYRLNLETGERELLFENTENVAGWQADLEGNLRLGTRVTEDGSTEVLRVDGDSLTSVYTCSVEETCAPVRFHKDGERVYMQTNQGEPDLTRLVLFNPQTEEEEVVESDPENEVDFGGAEFSDKTDELIATYYVGDRLRIYPKDSTFARDLETLREQLPEGEIYLGSSTKDENLHLVSVVQDVDPGATYLYNRETGEAELLYRSRPELPTEGLAEMRAIRYTARDGREIPAYLTLPKGVEPENLAVVINPHGGPWARDQWGYDGYAQFLANRGYAVLQPNFRGSTGYGKDFLNAGNGEWGDAMQDDITDGVRYLIGEGIADSSRVAIFGGSYGGYATLAGLTFTPDVYAAGVDVVGPSNLITLLNSIPPYWASIKRVFNVRMGDAENSEDAARLRRQSPVFSADKIRVPLLVVQGANDPRVKQAESDQIVVAARENNVDVEYLVAPDEGHGFRSDENRMALAVAMERFLAEHLGGRSQEEVPDEIAQQLRSITVDVGTVELPDTSLTSGAMEAPLPESDGSKIESGTMQYAATLQVQGQEIPMNVARTIEPATLDSQEVWKIVDVAETSMGQAQDTVAVDRSTLLPIQRSAGGMFAIRLDYQDGAITGEVTGGSQTTPIETSLDAPVAGDGPGLELFLMGLPLEKGYQTTLRSYDVQMQQVRLFRLQVTGAETVEVPAGTFETFALDLEPLDGEGGGVTLNMMREAPHTVVRGTYSLPPAMGGGTMKTELASTGADGEATGSK